jgi:putative Mg2+ transporter-C (MgtC) family protein
MPLSNTDLFLRLAVAIVLGGAIGWEREIREVPAGLRTHLLVSLASATFALVSFYVAYYQNYANNGLVRVDGARIASNIVVGMGFLGGGAIIRSGMSVRGLTTAASLWLTAAIGLAAGGGMLLLAVAATVISLFALSVLRVTIEMPRKRHAHLHVRIDLEGDFISRAALVEFLGPIGANVSGVDYRRDLLTNRSRMAMDVKLRDDALEEPLMKRLEELPGVRHVKVERVE